MVSLSWFKDLKIPLHTQKFERSKTESYCFFCFIADGGSSVGSGPLMSPGLWKTPSTSAGGQSTVMAELTNLVNAHPRAGMQAGRI